MANRFPFRRLTPLIACLTLFLAACVSEGAPPAATETVGADPQLVTQADVMQKTILEGAAAGAAAGGGIAIGFGGNSRDVKRGTSTGFTLGAAAGSYVALIQRKYLRKERRLREIREDLDENAAEMSAAIAVMSRVLAEQRAEIAAARAQLATGQADPAILSRRVGIAQANLSEMQRAVDGATARQSEFVETRRLVPTDTGSEIDPELAQLSQRIAAMRAIAEDLEQELAG